MTGVEFAAQLCTVFAVVCGAAVLAATRSARLETGVLLDFLLAAGLLRLTQQVTAGTLLAAAAVVAVRRFRGDRAGSPGRRCRAVTARWMPLRAGGAGEGRVR